MAGDFEWNAALPVATAAERASASILLRLGATTDAKQSPTTEFVMRDANGNASISNAALQAGNGNVVLIGRQGSAFPTGSTLGFFELRTNNNDAANGGLSIYRLVAGVSTLALSINFQGHVTPGADNVQTLGSAGARFSTVFAGTSAINTSDERAKQDIGAIPAAWLDAWGDVDWCRFKFTDGTRWHVGLIAQRVHAAFAAHGLDAFEIGLCCFDQWEDAFEDVVDDEGNVTDQRQVLSAGDRWGLRYDECQALEAAWQRRELVRKNDAIARLEARLAMLEAR